MVAFWAIMISTNHTAYSHPRTPTPTHTLTLLTPHAFSQSICTGDSGGDGCGVCGNFVQDHHESSRYLVARRICRFLVRLPSAAACGPVFVVLTMQHQQLQANAHIPYTLLTETTKGCRSQKKLDLRVQLLSSSCYITFMPPTFVQFKS